MSVAREGATPTDLGASDLVRALQRDTRNLTSQLRLELLWKHTNLERRHAYVWSLIENDEEARRICGAQLIGHCETFSQATGRRPSVLDFGCGPVSSITYLARSGLADVVGADALADEYRALLELHNIESEVPLRRGIGEFLDEDFDDASFDVVHVRNALDTTQAPALTWLNLFRLTRPGGLLVHTHRVRGGSAERFGQLHQFDLYPEGSSLWVRDRDGLTLSLTDGLPLAARWSSRSDRGWFTAAYERGSGEPDATLLDGALQQLRRVFRGRSAWAFELERLVSLLGDDPPGTGIPLRIHSDRA